MKSYVVTPIELDGKTVATPRGRVTLSPQQAGAVALLAKGGRVCRADLIAGYAAMSPSERMLSYTSMRNQLATARKKLRMIGLDVVCITGWGFRLGEVSSVNARVISERPTHRELEGLRAIDDGKRPANAVALLSDTDRMRIRNLSQRGLSLTGIASMIRKPYAAIAAELGAGR